MSRWLPYATLAALAVVGIAHQRRAELANESAAALAAAPPVAQTPHGAQHAHAHWSYAGADGPEHWGELDPAYAACAKGTHQTPVDIHGAIDGHLPPLQIDYRTRGTEVVNNGHTIQVNVEPGSFLTLDGVRYELKQFHFHSPSENEIDERLYAMEAHLVHGDKDGHLAVIGVLFQLGTADPAIAEVFKSATQSPGRRVLATPIDTNRLLPGSRAYYEFEGSFTTPPCTEGVHWIVMKQPLSVSRSEVAFLERSMHGHNNRPIQGLHGRAVMR